MARKRHNMRLHNDETEPELRRFTAPLPASYVPHVPWFRRFWWGIVNFFTILIRKINQFLSLILAVLLLLLFTRFLLTLFELNTSIFAHWVYMLSAPLLFPFNNLLPPLLYNGYTIDISTLIAILVYALAVTILRQFLKVLIARPY